MGSEPEPNEPEIALYAQHQRDKQRVIKAHGMEALIMAPYHVSRFDAIYRDFS